MRNRLPIAMLLTAAVIGVQISDARGQEVRYQFSDTGATEFNGPPAVATIDDSSPVVPAISKAFLPGPTDLFDPVEGEYDRGEGYQGLQWGFWGWLSYKRTPRFNRGTFWAHEIELDITRSFSEKIAATTELDFKDQWKDGLFVEQLFVSAVLPNGESVLTAGKFNSPFGIEERDFWNRIGGTPSLLFQNQPQDLTGLLLTHPLGNSNWTVQPMVVNGFGNAGVDNNEHASIALMVEYQQRDCFRLALTNWWGPEFDQNVNDDLYFVLVSTQWRPTQNFQVLGEFYYGSTEAAGGARDWSGWLAVVEYFVCDNLRVYSQYSQLDDRDGFHTGLNQKTQEASTGFGWFVDPSVEIRTAYRQNYRPLQGDFDEWSVAVSFGY